MPKITVEVRYAERPPELREFNQAKVIIGRDAGNIVLGDHLASGRHAELNVTNYGVMLVDLGSTNGTFMASGERVTSQMPLRPGSEFRIGTSVLVLRSFESGAPLGPKGTFVMTAADPNRAQAELAETAAASASPPSPAPYAVSSHQPGSPAAPSQVASSLGAPAVAAYQAGPAQPAASPSPYGGPAQPGMGASYANAGYPAQPGYGPPTVGVAAPASGYSAGGYGPPGAPPAPAPAYGAPTGFAAPGAPPGVSGYGPPGFAPAAGSPGYPQGQVAQGHAPQGYPSQGGQGQGYPGQGYPGQGYPGQGHPGQGHSGQGHPGQGYPGQGHPAQGHPGQGYAGQGYPGQSVGGYGAPGGAGAPGHHAATGAPGYGAQPGAPYGQAPMGAGYGAGRMEPAAPMGGAPSAVPTDPIALLKQAVDLYKPHLVEVAKAVGLITVPLPVLAALSGYVPVVGGILALVFGIVWPLAMALIGFGIEGEVGLRISAGAGFTSRELWSLQLRRMFPWFFGILVPSLIAGLASILCFVPGILFGLFLLPAYMVERKTMLDVNMRSFDLIKKDWMLCLVPPLLVAIPVSIALFVVNFVLAFVPYAGPILAAAVQGVAMAVFGPFMAHLVFRVYLAVRQKYENVQGTQELQAAVGRV